MNYWQQMSWAARFSTACFAGVAVIFPLCWIALGFGSLGLSATATVALALGITFTVALGIGLMGLVFYSNRSGQDDAAGANLVGRKNEDG